MTANHADWLGLALCTGAVALSAILHVTDDDAVALDARGTRRVPDLCLFHRFTGMRCPSCGMGRAFIALGHLDLAAAWRHNRVAPLLYLFALLQIPHRALRIASPAWRRRTARADPLVTFWTLMAIIALLLANWGIWLWGHVGE